MRSGDGDFAQSRPVRVGEDVVNLVTRADRQQTGSGGERFGHQVTGFGVMLKAEQVPQFESQHGEQIHSACCRAAWLEFGIIIRGRIDEPAEAGRVSVDPDYVPGGESQQVVRQIGDDELDITHQSEARARDQPRFAYRHKLRQCLGGECFTLPSQLSTLNLLRLEHGRHRECQVGGVVRRHQELSAADVLAGDQSELIHHGAVPHHDERAAHRWIESIDQRQRQSPVECCDPVDSELVISDPCTSSADLNRKRAGDCLRFIAKDCSKS